MTQQNFLIEPTSPATIPAAPRSDNPLAAYHTSCQRCGSTDFTDHVLRAHDHAGRSTRRDCARCGWTFGFPLWYGKDREATR